jgi:hypothetical protein
VLRSASEASIHLKPFLFQAARYLRPGQFQSLRLQRNRLPS